MKPETYERLERRIIELGALVGLLANIAPENADIAREHAENVALLAERLVEEALQALKEAGRGESEAKHRGGLL